jgi:hypothetical protein
VVLAREEQCAFPWARPGAQETHWLARAPSGLLLSGMAPERNRSRLAALVAETILAHPLIQLGQERGRWEVLLDREGRRLPGPALVVRVLGEGRTLRAACWPGGVVYGSRPAPSRPRRRFPPVR